MTSDITHEEEAHTEAYKYLLEAMEERVSENKGKALVIASADARRVFMKALPDSIKQHYNCSTCKKFLDVWGGLAVVEDDGTLSSSLFPEGNWGELNEAVEALRGAISNSGVKRAPRLERRIGRASNYDTKRDTTWTHFHADIDVKLRPSDARDRFVMLQRCLTEYSLETLKEGHKLLTGGNLRQGERHAEMCAWLIKTWEGQNVSNKRNARNLLWRAAIEAPIGYANFRGGALGALLDEVKEGKSFEAIKRRFETVMDPLRYQRPQSVSVNQLKVGEELIEKLGYAQSLRRRKATIEDLKTFWVPEQVEASSQTGGSVFAHVKASDSVTQKTITQPTINITWAKFEKDILPSAKKMQVVAPHHGNFYQFTTAVDKTAPVIHQWGNHEAFYVYNQGSMASQFNVQAGANEVEALVRAPHEWEGQPLSNHAESVFFVIRNCHDTKNESGCSIFPSNLKSELHGARAAIEAYSRQTNFEPTEGMPAAGLRFASNSPIEVVVEGQRYRIDRWD